MENKLPIIVTRPVAYGVQVEWRWPANAYGEYVQLQCLYQDNRLTDEPFHRTARGKEITNLKPGEKIQIRARIVDHQGNAPDWKHSDWQDGAASYDAQDYLSEIDKQVRNTGAFKALNGDASIKDAMIKPASIAASTIEREHSLRAEAIAKEAQERSESSSQSVWVPSMTISSVDESIEQRTLSAVLSSALHQVNPDRAGDVAVKLAQAVNSAFQTLNSGFAAGGYVSSQWGIKMDPSVSHTTEGVDKSERSDCESDAHDSVSLKDIKDSGKGETLTFGGYPGALFTGKVDFNAAAAETRVVLSNEMKEAIKEVVRKCIEEQTRPGGLLYH